MQDMKYTLYAVTVPQKDPAPKPPIPNAILDKFDHCYDLDHVPTESEGLAETGGQLIKVDPNRDRLQKAISSGCGVAEDWRRFGYPDDSLKDADGKHIRLWLRARRLDPTQPEKPEPDAPPSSNQACNDIFKSVLSDCKYTFPIPPNRRPCDSVPPMFFL